MQSPAVQKSVNTNPSNGEFHQLIRQQYERSSSCLAGLPFGNLPGRIKGIDSRIQGVVMEP